MGTILVKAEEYNSHKVIVKFTMRIKDAITMLTYTEKLNTEQETEEPWQELQMELGVLHDDVEVALSTEYFKGYSDVIFELTVFIRKRNFDEKLNLTSEQIAGTVLSTVVEYFDWHRYSMEIAKTYHSKELRELVVFA